MLIPEWKVVIHKAWSMRLLYVASLLSGVEAILPYLDGSMPRGVFAMLAFVVTIGAMAARLIAQKEIANGTD